MPFDMLLQEKKFVFLRKIVNKYCVINVTLTEFKKPGCNALHSYDDADIDIIKLRFRSSLKYLITKISENKNLLV